MPQTGPQNPKDKYDARNPGVKPYEGVTDDELEREEHARREADRPSRRLNPRLYSSGKDPLWEMRGMEGVATEPGLTYNTPEERRNSDAAGGETGVANVGGGQRRQPRWRAHMNRRAPQIVGVGTIRKV